MSAVLAGQHRQSPNGTTYFVTSLLPSGDTARLYAPGDSRLLPADIVAGWPVVPAPHTTPTLGGGF